MSQTFPIILPEDAFDQAIYEPKTAFVQYFNQLTQQGFDPLHLPKAFRDLYLLDYYQGQVGNGGHSQFIGNSGVHLATNITHATRGAAWLGLTETEEILHAMAEWIAANPDEAAAQNGFSNRAAALDDLDTRLYAQKFTEDGIKTYLKTQPKAFAAWWTKTAADRGMYDLEKYTVTAAAWLFNHADLRRVARDQWQAEVETFAQADPAAVAQRKVTALQKATAAMPNDVILTLGRALRDVFGQGAYITAMPGAIADDLADGRHVFVEVGDRTVWVAQRGDALELHKTWRLNDFGAQVLRRFADPFISQTTALKFLIWGGLHRKGRQLKRARIDPKLRQLFVATYVPEALALWADGRDLGTGFARGRTMAFDPDAPRLAWEFELGLHRISLVAGGDGVTFRGDETRDNKRYPVAMLQAYRAEAAAIAGAESDRATG